MKPHAHSTEFSLHTLLACPACEAKPALVGGGIAGPWNCEYCGRTYRKAERGYHLVPDRLPEPLERHQALWEALQKNGSLCYELAPELNLFRKGSTEAEAFIDFMKLEGVVLDIGCGPQSWQPAYIDPAAQIEYVGLDPLAGSSLREFTFVHGLGECLPFVAAGFDNIVISSSLDHMMDFRRGLQEAARVLKSKGHIYIAMHEVDDEAENTQLLRRLADISLRTARQVVNGFRTMGLRRTYDYLRQATSLRIPKGAKDLFHVYFPTVEDVTHELFKNGVAVTKTGDCPGFLLLQGQKR